MIFLKRLFFIIVFSFSSTVNASMDWKLDDNVAQEKITLPTINSSFLAFKLEMFRLLPHREWVLKEQEKNWFTAKNHDCEIKIKLTSVNTVSLSYRGEKAVPFVGNRSQPGGFRSACNKNWLGYLLKDIKIAQQIVFYTEEAIALNRTSS